MAALRITKNIVSCTEAPCCKAARIIRIIMATKSCTNKNPTEILPYNDCKSCFSESNLTIMIVLLNVKAMEIYTDSITEKLSKYFVIKYPMIKVNIIWPMPVIREVLPTCLTSLKLSSMPTKNNKNAIPNSEKNLIVSMLLDPAKNWLNIIPVKIYASINGCFINLTK